MGLPDPHLPERCYGGGEGSTGVDDEFAAAGFANLGAWILGRNMFGPVRGPWPDDAWKGWWGAEPAVPRAGVRADPPCRARRSRWRAAPTFHFVTDGIHAALERRRRPRRAAGTCGSAAASPTIREYLRAGLVDEIHLAISPVLLGSGEALLAGIDLPALGFERTRHAATGTRCTSS